MTVELAYAEAGSGTPVVLLHAFPLSRVIFERQRNDLAAGYHVVTPDLRGFGESPLGEEGPSLDLMADDVAALLKNLGLERAVVGGLSMGGYVAMAMLRRHPQMISGLLLIDTKASADTPEARDNRLRIAEQVLQEGTAVLQPMTDQLLGRTTRAERPGVVAEVRRWLDQAAPEAVAWAQRAMAERPDSFATLAGHDIPAAVVVGEEDTLSPPDDAAAMAQAFPREAVTYVIPRVGHLSTVEDPASASATIRDALHHIT